jgi:signal transduction histidine kinase
MDSLTQSELQLKMLTTQLLRAQEDERKRIARELHDSIGSWLSAVKFSLENAAQQIEIGNPIQDLLKQLSCIVGHCIEESRRIITDLRPSALDDLGIVLTIRWFCRHYQTLYPNLAVEKIVEIAESEIPERLKIIIFRILQESMNNAAKYSRAKKIMISLCREENCLELLVEDDGVGFDVRETLSRLDLSRGLGLTSMKERAEISGGSLEISSTSGIGTKIRTRWDLSQQEHRSYPNTGS